MGFDGVLASGVKHGVLENGENMDQHAPLKLVILLAEKLHF